MASLLTAPSGRDDEGSCFIDDGGCCAVGGGFGAQFTWCASAICRRPADSYFWSPFLTPQELIAGFWIIEVSSREQAVDWACRVPLVDGRVELREAVFQILPVTYDDRFERPCDGEIRPIDEI